MANYVNRDFSSRYCEERCAKEVDFRVYYFFRTYNHFFVNLISDCLMFHAFVNKPYLVTRINFTHWNGFLVNHKHFAND